MSGLIYKVGGSQSQIWIASAIVITMLALFFLKVDLEPKITPDFFFSSDSEFYKKAKLFKINFHSGSKFC